MIRPFWTWGGFTRDTLTPFQSRSKIPPMPKEADYLDRFMDKIVMAQGCWTWTGAAHFRVGEQFYTFRRWAWLYFKDSLPPPGMYIHSNCGNLRCVFPDHMELRDPKQWNKKPQTV
jgi:hypothetical protein